MLTIPDLDFRVDTTVDDGGITVAVHGEIDLATAPHLHDVVDRAVAERPHRLIIDLADTTFIDCSGVAVLAAAARSLPPGICQLIVRSPRPPARKLLEITGLLQVYAVESSSPGDYVADPHFRLEGNHEQ